MNTDSISTSPDQKEGYICPSCRLLFATIPDVGGNGVVCPGCGKLLTVPMPEDGIAAQDSNQVRYKQAGLSAVDQMEDAYRRDRQWEKKRHEQMEKIATQDKELRWMVPLALIAVVLLGGLAYVLMNSGSKKPVLVNTDLEEDAVDAVEQIVMFDHNDPEARTKLENYLEKVLASKTVDEMSKQVRDVEGLREKMLKYYGGETIDRPGFNRVKESYNMIKHNGYIVVDFEDDDFKNRTAIIKHDGGLLELDWESYIGYSDVGWNELQELKPVQPVVLRVILTVNDFYLGDYSDEKKWQSVALTNPNVDGTIYGYVRRGSEVEQLVSNFGMTTADYKLTVRVKYPENASRKDQLEIIEVLSSSWLVVEK